MVFFSSKGNTANRGARHNGADPEYRFMIVGQVMVNAGGELSGTLPATDMLCGNALRLINAKLAIGNIAA